MVRFSIDDVRQFVSEMKNPEKLLRGCRKYHELEPRDILYVAAREVMLKKPASELHLLAGVKILLLTWNAVYFQRLPASIKESIEKDILEAHQKTKEDFASLSSERLESIDLNSPVRVREIKRIFKAFSGRRSIETTGASKAIHLIHPELFVMWDSRIRTNYHRLHPSYRIRSEAGDECYIEFMKTSQEMAKAVLQRSTMDEMRQEHTVQSKEPQLLNAFPQAALESLPKMLDECNYVKFTNDSGF